MRIAILNWSNRRIGGTGTYLSAVDAASAAGRSRRRAVARGRYAGRLRPDSAAAECAGLVGGRSRSRARACRTGDRGARTCSTRTGCSIPQVERRTLDIAPAVFFAHNYYGTCISGAKTFRNPVVTPCDRRFGWQCLAQYYPRRCGGLSPVTMVRLFRQQRDRLELLSRYGAIVTHSAHMQNEYVNHGLTASRVFNVKYGSDLERSAEPCASPSRPRRLTRAGPGVCCSSAAWTN